MAGSATIDISHQGDFAWHLAPWNAATGRLGPATPIFATPSGTVLQAVREGGQVYSLALGAGMRGVLEAPGTGRRLAIPFGGERTIEPELPVDLVADDRQWTVLSSEGTMLGGSWNHGVQWRLPGSQLFSPYIGHDDPPPVLARQHDGTLMAFFVGRDLAGHDDLPCAGLSHVSADGRVLASRRITLPAADARIVEIGGGGAALYRGRRLLIANTWGDAQEGETEIHETRIYDMDSRQSTPLLTLGDGEVGTLSVHGAVVLGDRLYVGCGPGGIAVIEARP